MDFTASLSSFMITGDHGCQSKSSLITDDGHQPKHLEITGSTPCAPLHSGHRWHWPPERRFVNWDPTKNSWRIFNHFGPDCQSWSVIHVQFKLPSGKWTWLLYGKRSLIISFFPLKMVMFHSHVRLPVPWGGFQKTIHSPITPSTSSPLAQSPGHACGS